MKKILVLIIAFTTINISCSTSLSLNGYWINIRSKEIDNHPLKKTDILSSHLIRIQASRYKIFRLNKRNSISHRFTKTSFSKLKYISKDSIVIEDNNYSNTYKHLNDSLKVKSENKIILTNRTFTLKTNNHIDTLKFLKNCRMEYSNSKGKNLISYKRVRERGYDIILIDKPLNTFVIRNELNDKLEISTISLFNKNLELKKVK
ncbi:hypothetical protein [Flavicella sediminum]|uniref:hypothetical protein n=1 Tax=Flavicella sediminum TaxID=2585141 RepID=UPI0011240A21|nr:hypothetical protein [Flavicella sediminum]